MGTNYGALSLPARPVRRTVWMSVLVVIAVGALGWLGYRITTSITQRPQAVTSRSGTAPTLADNPELAIARPLPQELAPSLVQNPELAIAKPFGPRVGAPSLADNPELAIAGGFQLGDPSQPVRQQGTRPTWGGAPAPGCGMVRSPVC